MVAGPAEIRGEFCTLNLVTSAGLKFYFVIDVTGSNRQTDPGRVRRTAGMRALVNAYPTARFALQTFSADSGNNLFVPFQGASDFQKTLDSFQANSARDSGGTPYADTLRKVEANIRSYLTQQSILAVADRDRLGPIDIIFLSDGTPTDGVSTGTVDQLVHNIINLPVALGALETVDEIVVNSGLYGGLTGTPSELRQIATSGYGTYFDFSTGLVDLKKFRIPADRAPLAESVNLFASNLNVVWKKGADGSVSLEADSDGDGLSDREEILLQQQGLAPPHSEFNADSDANGLSDGIEALYYGTPCVHANCSKPTQSEDVRRLTSCDGIAASDGGPTGHATHDILNNCEKLVARADYRVFSTLGDKIPDGVKIRSGISPRDANLGQTSVQGGDPSILEKLVANLPWWLPHPEQTGFTPTRYSLNYIGLRDNRSCYSFVIRDILHKDLPSSPLNRVRIWLTQTDADHRDLLRTADVMISGSQIIQLTDADFTN